jgi:peptide methionine sulfoxide reductase msrA/msrB
MQKSNLPESISQDPAMDKKDPPADTARAYFASGCFWGTEFYLQRVKGVIATTVGYTGGHKENPTYKEVCTGSTGHAETTEVLYDPTQISFKELAKIFFETHDPTQVDGQGPDIGTQYRSAIFYVDEEQKKVSEELVDVLTLMGYKVATEISPASTFYAAEDYHQDYYNYKGTLPYCHSYQKKF